MSLSQVALPAASLTWPALMATFIFAVFYKASVYRRKVFDMLLDPGKAWSGCFYSNLITTLLGFPLMHILWMGIVFYLDFEAPLRKYLSPPFACLVTSSMISDRGMSCDWAPQLFALFGIGFSFVPSYLFSIFFEWGYLSWYYKKTMPFGLVSRVNFLTYAWTILAWALWMAYKFFIDTKTY